MFGPSKKYIEFVVHDVNWYWYHNHNVFNKSSFVFWGILLASKDLRAVVSIRMELCTNSWTPSGKERRRCGSHVTKDVCGWSLRM